VPRPLTEFRMITTGSVFVAREWCKLHAPTCRLSIKAVASPGARAPKRAHVPRPLTGFRMMTTARGRLATRGAARSRTACTKARASVMEWQW